MSKLDEITKALDYTPTIEETLDEATVKMLDEIEAQVVEMYGENWEE